MTEFSRPPSFDFGAATLQGFRLPGGSNYILRVSAWTALIVTVLYVVLGTPIVRGFADMFGALIEMEHSLDGSDPDPDVVFAALAPMIKASGYIFLLTILQTVAFASAETAIYRNLFYADDKGIFPLRLGVDEWRVVGTRIVMSLVLGTLFFIAYFAVVLFGALIMGLAGAMESGVIAAIGGLLVFCLVLAAIAAFIWMSVRLAPAAAYSVRDRKFDPLASWRPMRGRVWPAIGGYLILYFVGYFGISLVLSIVFVIAFLFSGVLKILIQLDSDGQEIPNFTPLWEHMSSAQFLIPVILAVLISMFMTVLWYGMIWGMWGYFAKTDQDVQNDNWTDGETWEM